MKRVFLLFFIVASLNCFAWGKIDERGFNLKTKMNKETNTLYDKKGYDIDGYDIDGYDKNEFSRVGINKNTGLIYDENEFDSKGNVNFEYYRLVKSPSYRELFKTSRNLGKLYRKGEFETIDEYNTRIKGYSKELNKIYSYQNEIINGKYDYWGAPKYNSENESWEIYWSIAGSNWENEGKPVGIREQYYEIKLRDNIKVSFPMKISEAKLNQKLVVQYLYSLQGESLEKDYFKDSDIFTIYTGYDYSELWHIEHYITYIKCVAVIVWDEKKEKVLYYKKI